MHREQNPLLLHSIPYYIDVGGLINVGKFMHLIFFHSCEIKFHPLRMNFAIIMLENNNCCGLLQILWPTVHGVIGVVPSPLLAPPFFNPLDSFSADTCRIWCINAFSTSFTSPPRKCTLPESSRQGYFLEFNLGKRDIWEIFGGRFRRIGQNFRSFLRVATRLSFTVGTTPSREWIPSSRWRATVTPCGGNFAESSSL